MVLDHHLRVEVGCRTLRHQSAEVEDGDLVGDGEDVNQVVRDHHDRRALARQPFDELEHLFGLGHPEGGGGLVHDHELGGGQDRLGHGDGLALPARQRRHRLADGAHGRDVEIGQHLARLDLHGGLVEEPVPQLLVPEEQVLDDVQVVAQREVLVDRRDPERLGVVRAVDVGRLALPEDLRPRSAARARRWS